MEVKQSSAKQKGGKNSLRVYLVKIFKLYNSDCGCSAPHNAGIFYSLKFHIHKTLVAIRQSNLQRESCVAYTENIGNMKPQFATISSEIECVGRKDGNLPILVLTKVSWNSSRTCFLKAYPETLWLAQSIPIHGEKKPQNRLSPDSRIGRKPREIPNKFGHPNLRIGVILAFPLKA